MTYRPDSQPARLLRYLREHPGSSSLEITQALWIVNVTGRISDLRAARHVIECRKAPDGRDSYFLMRPPEPTVGEQIGMELR